ncbi:MAG: hypothetical protein WDN31_21730 [Hyphomicrobium sp.]
MRAGRLVDEPRHMARLSRSLGELHIRQPMSAAALSHVMREVVRRKPGARRPRLSAGDARRRPPRIPLPLQ